MMRKDPFNDPFNDPFFGDFNKRFEEANRDISHINKSVKTIIWAQIVLVILSLIASLAACGGLIYLIIWLCERYL
jgi:hypothetical protein